MPSASGATEPAAKKVGIAMNIHNELGPARREETYHQEVSRVIKQHIR